MKHLKMALIACIGALIGSNAYRYYKSDVFSFDLESNVVLFAFTFIFTSICSAIFNR